MLLEGDDTATSLVRFMSDSGITNLVLGSCYFSCITRYNVVNFDITNSMAYSSFPRGFDIRISILLSEYTNVYVCEFMSFEFEKGVYVCS